NNYYGFDRLKNYVENLWGQDQNGFNDNSIYKINDPDGYTNLRKEKNTSSEILQKINTGSEVQVFDNSGDWWLIQTKEGKKGYVYKTKIKEE
ncbi:SH3 domain-containing protein, partial [Flavobacterium sp. ACN2]|uniref:SH3 domain-containing protein n=1 Tax=Flavobacterium sp. ACN2 TaxID=1975676 RepID=UPI0011435837